MKSNWIRFIQECITQIQLWLFLVLLQWIFRVIMILWFYKNISTTTIFNDILLALFHGFRFDSKIASLFLLFPFLFNLILSSLNRFSIIFKLRLFFTGLGIVLILLSSIATLPYFEEFDNQFNFFLFDLLYDDQVAVFKTVLFEYHLIINIIVIITLSIIAWHSLRRFQSYVSSFINIQILSPKSIIMKFFIIFFLIIGFTGSIRGSFKNRPAIRKWSYITSDNFLNKTIMNPLTHLQYAIKDFKKINKKTDITQFIGELSPKTAAENYFDVTKDSSLSSYLRHIVPDSDNKMPNHIFLVIMESYDMWPLLPEYRSLGLGENLQYFGEKGIFFNRFLPSGESTMASVSAILTGAPYIGINISRIASEREPLPTSIPFIFEKFGYKTQLFYGGFLSWQNIGNLFQSQGFDNVFGSPEIEKNNSDIIWGVDDDLLFSFIEEKTLAETKSFNVVLTTSYHPPYNVDVEKFGFPLKNIPPGLISKFDGSMTMKQLGHIWYSDWAIGEFVKKVEKRYPESLFIFTGDHYGRRFINSHPTLYERSTVPLIIYGKNFITPDLNMISTPGSHIDIIPTIISLIAPNQFEYQSFGNPLLQKKGATMVASGNKIGFGYRKIILDNYIIDVNDKFNNNIAILDGKDSRSNKVLEIINKQKLLFGLTWWRIFKGNILKSS